MAQCVLLPLFLTTVFITKYSQKGDLDIFIYISIYIFPTLRVSLFRSQLTSSLSVPGTSSGLKDRKH